MLFTLPPLLLNFCLLRMTPELQSIILAGEAVHVGDVKPLVGQGACSQYIWTKRMHPIQHDQLLRASSPEEVTRIGKGVGSR